MHDTKRTITRLPHANNIRMSFFTDWEGTDLQNNSHYRLQLTFTGITAELPPVLAHAVELYGLSCIAEATPPLRLTVSGKRNDVLGFTKALPSCSPLPYRFERIVSYFPKDRND